ncbi:MAG: transglutaminase domain-containing protein [Patescibacteria group bacterium]
MLRKICLFLIVCLALFSCPTWAINEFETSYQIDYQVGPRGSAQVNQEITLKNNFSNIYPKEYRLEIGGKQIENVSATDANGNIIQSVNQKDNSLELSLKFNQESIGKNAELTFKLSYLIPQFAQKRGQVWEANFPSFANLDKIDQINLSIKTPLAFGQLAYSSIPFANESVQDGHQILSYSKGNLTKGPLSLAFGEFQVLEFKIKYQLENPNQEIGRINIPIPPDTAYQSVILKNIAPKPEKIFLDGDQNWLAQYTLDPGQNLEVIAEGQARIYSQAENIKLIEINKKTDKSQQLLPDTFWESDAIEIKQLAQLHQTPRAIYNFVVDTLEYDYQNLDQIKRLGAQQALLRKSGVCTEFSDLFVSIARAAGIPARELEGFAFSNDPELTGLQVNNDVLHSWPEYWDEAKQTWIPLDPTWDKTTGGMKFFDQLGLNHFVFVIHGIDSVSPAPPGSYKNQTGQKTIEVGFASDILPFPSIDLSPGIEVINHKSFLAVQNNSPVAAYQIQIDQSGWNGKQGTQIETIEILPPFAKQLIPIQSPRIWARIFFQPEYHVKVDNQAFELPYPQKLNFRSFFVKLLGR